MRYTRSLLLTLSKLDHLNVHRCQFIFHIFDMTLHFNLILRYTTMNLSGFITNVNISRFQYYQTHLQQYHSQDLGSRLLNFLFSSGNMWTCIRIAFKEHILTYVLKQRY